MPTLNWIGKDKVINHHSEVPYRVLKKKYTYNNDGEFNDESNISENMIIHGDNLEALKSLLPKYEGRIKCIYIDPPYNTGNEGWVYNDNVSDPKMLKWLGDVVGKEGDDLSRHDKWLCMMYPRLRLLHKLLSNDGVIFISIDDTEAAHLRLVCDEIFGYANFMADLIWQHSVQSNGYGGKFVSQYNHTFVYKKTDQFILGFLPRTDEDNKLYRNPDNDPKGPWRSGYCVNGLYRPNLKYQIITPSGNVIEPPEKGWRWSKETLESKIASGEIVFNADETNIIHKLYLNDLEGKVPENIWANGIAGTTRQATAMLKSIFDGKAPFDTPKPVELLERIISISMGKDDIILDSFAGSGTTAHAILNKNENDNGNRKFILVEMEDYAESITAERVKRAISGYGSDATFISGVKGDFSYFELGERLFDEFGDLNSVVDSVKIREYIWFMETREASGFIVDEDSELLGTNKSTAYYFVYDKEEVTTLDMKFLSTIKEKQDAYVIYADVCTISDSDLAKWNITFKKIPRDISKL